MLNVLVETRKLLRNGHGWTKGSFHKHGTNQFCLVGAVSSASYFVRDMAPKGMYGLEYNLVLKHLAQCLGGVDDKDAGWELTQWNDAPGRTWKDIDNLLSKAIQAAEDPDETPIEETKPKLELYSPAMGAQVEVEAARRASKCACAQGCSPERSA